ncbi:DUF7563 family protein [Halosolutus gelatinilyticus]|uniref:DUF7563 family protein n=1 Tax=Halosolutus gelatinilyticus TaxID=2931975 RepID=UPI003CE52E2C
MSADRPTWADMTLDDGHHCLSCGAHVHERTIAGYGDNDGNLFACPDCSTPRDLRQGAGRDPDYDLEEDRGQSTASGYHPIFGDSDE